jgi:general secretion pathway protein D
LKYGVEWYIKNRQKAAGRFGDYTVQTLGQLGFQSLGLTYKFISDAQDIQAMISAFANDNKANILSTPRLTVLDNKEASIQVGEDVPTVTGEVTASDVTTTTAGKPSVLRNIAYRSTGVLLKVKPTINTEGLLTLDINQEVSVPGAGGIGDSPIILIRRITTSVSIAHGQTIALGGLIKENSGVSETKVPLLGDVPILGNLFKTTSKTKTKTGLLVLVTPTILVTADDASKVTDAMKKELRWFR